MGNRKQVESDDPKILFCEWAVKGEIALQKCLYFLAKIDDFHLK
jgi:hypothetical protein